MAPSKRAGRLVCGSRLLAALACAGCGQTGDRTSEAESNGLLRQHVQAAQEQVRAGKFPAAVKAAKAGLALDSTSADLNNLLATAEASQGRYRPAIDALERALRHHPDFALGHLNLGGLYTKLGRFDLVEISLERALELRPDWSSVHRRLAELYLGSGRPEAAVEAIRKAIGLFPGDATLTFYLGRSLETAGREEAAMAAFRHAADLDIGFEEALYRLSVLARRSGRHALADSALERFEHLQRIGNDPEIHKKMKKLRSSILNAPEDGAHHYALGAFFSRWGYWDEALDKFARAAALAPGDPHRLNQIGSLLVQNSRPGEAIPYFEDAIAADSTFVPAIANLGTALDLLDRGREAMDCFRRALLLRPADPNVHLSYGVSLLKAGRTEEALEKLESGRALTAADSRLRARFDRLLSAAAAAPDGTTP